MSNSTSWLLVNYFRTRFPAWLVLSLPLVILFPALVCGRFAVGGDWIVAWLISVLLFVEFRIWDDLSDRELDCREDPSRVLCQTTSLKPFYAVLLAILTLNFVLAMWQTSWFAVEVLCGLHVLLAIWYLVRPDLKLGPVGNYHAVLLKYPACGLIVAAPSDAATSSTLFAPLAVVYLGLCIVEVLHDRRLRGLNAAWICFGIEVTLLAGILAWRSI